MSLHAVASALAYRGCPSSSAKLVLIALANFQNANGWCYPSAKRIAEETDLDLKTVRSSLAGLELSSIIIDTGKRVGRTKQVKVYSLNLESHPKAETFARRATGDAVGPDDAQDEQRSPVSDDADQPAPAQPVGDETHPNSGTLNAPVFPEEDTRKRVTEPVTGTSTPKGAKAPSAPTGARRDRGIRIPEDWVAPPISELPPQAQAIAKQWPVGAYEAQAEAHLNFWRGQPGPKAKKVDWRATWCNRVVEIGAKPIRDGKNGVIYGGLGQPDLPPLIFDKPGERAELRTFRLRACDVLGAFKYRSSLDDADMRVLGEKLLITVTTDFQSYQLRDDTPRLDRLAKEIVGARFIRFEARDKMGPR